MATFSVEVWALLGAIGLGTVLAMLYTIAAGLRDAQDVANLRVRCHQLRQEYMARLAEMQEGEFDIVEAPEAGGEGPAEIAAEIGPAETTSAKAAA